MKIFFLLLPITLFGQTTLFYNAKIHTSASLNTPDAAWMLVKDGKVLKTGKEELPKAENYSKVDLNGKVLFPSLTDSHAHILDLGKSQFEVNFRGVKSSKEAVARLKEYIAKNKLQGTKAILGNDWDQSDWPGKQFPSRLELDEITQTQPIILYRVDGHAAWVNTAALKQSGIWERKADPQGGKIHRDSSNLPTGILIDTAMDDLSSLIKPPTLDESKEYITVAVNHAASLGITSIHDAGVSQTTLTAIKNLLRSRKIKFRFYEMLSGSDPQLKNLLKQKPTIGQYGGQLDVRAVKLFIDGAMGSRGALFEKPYADDASTSGLQFHSKEELARLVSQIHKAHYQVAVHAIGSKGNKLVLDAFESLRDKNIADKRHRLEHAQVLELNDIKRAAKMGVIASMQPTHCTSDMKWVVDRIGSERARYAYAWKSMLQNKVPLAFGSDAPVESLNPWPGLFSSITRQNTEFEPKEGFNPEERLTLQESFEAFTSGAAYAAFREAELGTLSKGHYADFIILGKNPYELKPLEIYNTKVEATYIGGEKVFERNELPRS